MNFKGVIICALSAVMLCSCADDANSGEVAETAEVSETEPVTSAETAAETTALETSEKETEETPQTVRYSYDSRVQSYMEQLESFNEVLPQAAYCYVCDLDSDSTPEVVIQAAANISASAVFSVDNKGAFMAEPAGGTVFTDEKTWCSYNGDIPKSFILDGKDQYFAECFVGGTAGDGGIIKLELNGRKLSSEYIGRYSFSGAMGYEYSGFENEKQYNEYIRSYFSKLEPQWKLMPYSDVLDIEEKSPRIISALLEEFYSDRDSLAELEEVLDVDLEYDIVFKKTFSRTEYNESGNVDENSYSYDYAGNPLEDEYNKKLRYTYYPSGKIRSEIYNSGRIYTYDENGNLLPDDDELTYDDFGRIETRTEFSSFSKGEILCITEYFYKGDTDELIKEIRNYTDGRTETYTYENGLEVRYEKVGQDTYYNTVITTEYNASGLISKTERFDKDMNLARTITYEYDSGGRLICENSVTTEYYDNGCDRCDDYCYSYKFDGNGKLLEKIYVLRTYGGTLKYEYIYDKNGDLSEEIFTADHDNEIANYSAGTYVTTYSYEYDLAGNIIRSVKKYEDDLSIVTDYRAVRVIKAAYTDFKTESVQKIVA